MGNSNSTNSKRFTTSEVYDFITVQQSKNETLQLKLLEQVFDKIKSINNVRIITFSGKTGIGKSTALNTLLYFYKYPDLGKMENIFESNAGLFSVTKGMNICLEEITFNDIEELKQDKFLLVDLEGLNSLQKGMDNQSNEAYNKLIDKLYALLLLISDVFIFNLPDRLEETDVEAIDKIIKICSSIERKRQDVEILNEINFDNFFIWKRNCSQINYDMEKKIFKKLNMNKKPEDWIFAIKEIDSDYRETLETKYLRNSGYGKAIKPIMNKIIDQVKKHERKFNLNRLESYVKLINEDNEEMGEIIKMEFKLKLIRERIDMSVNAFIIQNGNILNDYNFPIYHEEIIKEEANKFIQEQLEQQNEIDIEIEKILKNDKINQPNDTNIPSLKSTNKANPVTNMLEFHNTEIISTQQMVRNDGHTGYIIKLKTGDSYLLFQAANGKIVTTDSFYLSNNWKSINSPQNASPNLRVIDAIREGQKDSFLTNNLNKSEKKNVFGEENVNYAGANLLFGSIIAKLIMSENSKKSGWNISKELAISTSIVGVTASLTMKVPWISFAFASALVAYQTGSALLNDSLTGKGKGEICLKNVTQMGANCGIGVGGMMSGAAIGTAIFPGIGTVCGLAIGALIGGGVGALTNLRVI